MPNLDPWIKEYENKYSIAEERSKFEYYLLSISDERQKIIRPNYQITYNERQELDKKCLVFDTNYGIERHFEDRNPITCNMCGFTY